MKTPSSVALALCLLSIPQSVEAWTSSAPVVTSPKKVPPPYRMATTALFSSTNNQTLQMTDAPSVSPRVETANQNIEDLTDAFLDDDSDLDVDDFLAALELEVDKIESAPPPKKTQADQVVAVAKTGAAALIKGVTVLAEEGAELVDTLPDLVEIIPSAKVGNRNETYGQAASKVGKGAQGVWALASAFGGFVKDTVENEMEERSQSSMEEEQVEELEEEAELEEVAVEEEEPEVQETAQVKPRKWGIGFSAFEPFLKEGKEAELEEEPEAELEEPEAVLEVEEAEQPRNVWRGIGSALESLVQDAKGAVGENKGSQITADDTDETEELLEEQYEAILDEALLAQQEVDEMSRERKKNNFFW